MSKAKESTTGRIKRGTGDDFGRLVAQYIRLEHKRAVYRMLLQVIDPFLPDDSGKVSRVWSDRLCMRPEIDSDVFLDIWGVLRHLEDKTGKELEKLSSSRVNVAGLSNKDKEVT